MLRKVSIAHTCGYEGILSVKPVSGVGEHIEEGWVFTLPALLCWLEHPMAIPGMSLGRAAVTGHLAARTALGETY